MNTDLSERFAMSILCGRRSGKHFYNAYMDRFHPKEAATAITRMRTHCTVGQFRFPRSKRKRIRRKWEKDSRNYRDASWNIWIDEMPPMTEEYRKMMETFMEKAKNNIEHGLCLDGREKLL